MNMTFECKLYGAAPLPFQGQKRMWRKEIKALLEGRFKNVKRVVDVFGGSGLLSNWARAYLPKAEVIWNDFDDYQARLAAIPKTNAILAEARATLAGKPKHERLNAEEQEKLKATLKPYEKEANFDSQTIYRSFMFSSATDMSEKGFHEEKALYNNMSAKIYEAEGYLVGVKRESKDYKELLEKYPPDDETLLLLDPPYLNTDNTRYSAVNSWTLKTYLDILKFVQNGKYIYFTSNKSDICELGEFLRENTNFKIFENTERFERKRGIAKGIGYMDYLIVSK